MGRASGHNTPTSVAALAGWSRRLSASAPVARGAPLAQSTALFTNIRRRSPFDLHDVLSETFRRAFEERARLAYSGLIPYEAYLRTIARNLVVDRLREQARGIVAIEEVAEADLGVRVEHDESGLPPDEVAQRGELKELVARFVFRLGPTERSFVTLRYEERLSQEEVASRLGTSRRAVRVLEAKLRRRLLRHLEGTGYSPAAETGRPAAEERDGLC
ncbi:MAG: sigma-70 family RNA polymerase sigma factor [Deltaproteobacteria bacterium]|nr:sigma-70 family RNA polymerase sigma factor [Deltaproteobacteria bacterium]